MLYFNCETVFRNDLQTLNSTLSLMMYTVPNLCPVLDLYFTKSRDTVLTNLTKAVWCPLTVLFLYSGRYPTMYIMFADDA